MICGPYVVPFGSTVTPATVNSAAPAAPWSICPRKRWVAKSSSAASTNLLSWLNSAWWPLPSGRDHGVFVPGCFMTGSSIPKSESPMIVGFCGSVTSSLM